MYTNVIVQVDKIEINLGSEQSFVNLQNFKRDNVRWYKIFGGLFVTFADFFNAIKLNMITSGNQCQNDNFENLRNVPSSNTEDILLYNACDPDNNFFNTNVHNLNTVCILPENF